MSFIAIKQVVNQINVAGIHCLGSEVFPFTLPASCPARTADFPIQGCFVRNAGLVANNFIFPDFCAVCPRFGGPHPCNTAGRMRFGYEQVFNPKPTAIEKSGMPPHLFKTTLIEHLSKITEPLKTGAIKKHFLEVLKITLGNQFLTSNLSRLHKIANCFRHTEGTKQVGYFVERANPSLCSDCKLLYCKIRQEQKKGPV